MYSLDLKTVDKIVYRRENSSIQSKFGHEDLVKIRSRPAGLTSLSGSVIFLGFLRIAYIYTISFIILIYGTC